MSRIECDGLLAVYRMSLDRTPVPMLLPVRSSGHYRVDAGWRQDPKVGHSLELFWMVSGACEFTFDGVPVPVKADEVCFFFPNDRHLECALQDGTEFYWMCIDGDYVPDLIGAYRLKRLPFYAGHCPTDEFDRLCDCVDGVDVPSQYRASSIAISILNKACAASCADPRPNAIADEFISLCRSRFCDPGCTVGLLADEMKVHRSSLHRLFLRYQNQSPKEYLTSCRIQKALQMLLNTRSRICEIAQACGFANENYFIKVFRKYLGKTPGEMRREYAARFRIK